MNTIPNQPPRTPDASDLVDARASEVAGSLGALENASPNGRAMAIELLSAINRIKMGRRDQISMNSGILEWELNRSAVGSTPISLAEFSEMAVEGAALLENLLGPGFKVTMTNLETRHGWNQEPYQSADFKITPQDV